MPDEILNPAEDLNTLVSNEPPVDEVHDDKPDDTPELSGEEELLKALRALAEEDTEVEPEEEVEPETEPEPEKEPEVTPEPEKKEQTPEENAKFAAQRRQAEMQKRIDSEMEKLRNEAPEFALAKQLSEMYGVDPKTLLDQVKDAQLKKESEQKGVPLELLKEREADRQRTSQLEQELNKLKYESWKTRVDSEGQNLQQQYKMLTEDDIQESVNYMLNIARNVDMPLEQAVYAVHGKKIVESLAQAKVQDELAKQSGRGKKTPLSPNNAKPSEQTTLTAEEQYMAKQFGMTDADYLKYKS